MGAEGLEWTNGSSTVREAALVIVVMAVTPERSTSPSAVVNQSDGWMPRAVSVAMVFAVGRLDPLARHSKVVCCILSERARAVTLLACDKMRTAARYFSPVRLSEVERAYGGVGSLPSRALLVTIDDAYADVQTAVPIALKLGFPVGIFARAAAADGLPSWAPLDLLYQARAHHGRVVDAIERNALLKLALADQLARGFMEAGGEEATRPWRQELYASESLLRGLASTDVEIGAHGVEHVRWTELDDRGIRDTLRRTRDWLRRFGPFASDAMAYPDGGTDPRVAQVVGELGVSVAFTIGSEPVIGVAPRYAIRREVPRDDPQWIESLVAGSEAAE